MRDKFAFFPSKDIGHVWCWYVHSLLANERQPFKLDEHEVFHVHKFGGQWDMIATDK